MRAENVVLVDFSGRVLDGNAYVNDTIRLHGIIHRESPRVSKGFGYLIANGHFGPRSVSACYLLGQMRGNYRFRLQRCAGFLRH